MKEKYESPDITLLNDEIGTDKPQPVAGVLVLLIFGILILGVWAGAVYQVAGAIEVYAAVNAVTKVVQIDVHQ